MVPCLHQCNNYIQRKLRVWREQKCIPLVGENPHLPVRPGKIPHVMWGRIGPRTKSCIHWGGPMAMVQCSHQGTIYIQRKLRVWRAQKCIPLVGAVNSLICADQQTALSHGGQYRAENGNLRKFGWNYRHGTVFAPRHCVYQKKPMGMDSPEMFSTSRCINPTCLCGSANYPISWGGV